MTTSELKELFASAFRERDPHGHIRWSPAYYDLDARARREAFEEVVRTRTLEAALDPDGLSSTGHAVLARIRRTT